MIKKKVNGSIMNFANMNEAQSGDNSITAFVEVSPAEAAHSIGDYIIYNHIVYQVIDDIDILDILIVDSNIEVAVLPEGTVIYSNDEQGTADFLSYDDLSDKPQINNVELASGNNSLSALGIASESAVNGIKDGQSINSFSAVESALGNKVDKVEGKGLSTNDYSDTEKGKVADNTSAIEAIENVLGAKNLWNLNDATIFTANASGTYTLNAGVLTVTSSGTRYSGVYRDITNDISNDVKDTPIIIEFDYKANDNIDVYIGIANVSIEQEATTDFKHFSLAVDSFSEMASRTVVVYDATTSAHTITLKNFQIRPAGTDATYVPYAMTNRELTERVDFVPHMIRGTYTSDGTYGAIYVPYDTKYNPTIAVAFIEDGFAASPYHLNFSEISGGYLVFAVRDSVGNPQKNTAVDAVLFYY